MKIYKGEKNFNWIVLFSHDVQMKSKQVKTGPSIQTTEVFQEYLLLSGRRSVTTKEINTGVSSQSWWPTDSQK